MKHWQLFVPLVICMCALLWGLTALKFSFTWVRHKGPQDPPQIWTKVYYFHILGLNIKISYPIVSLFDMYIDMDEKIAGKQDRPSLTIEGPLRAPPNSPKYTLFFTFWLMYEKLVFKLFPLVVHMSPLWWCDEGCICWHFGAPDTPGFHVRAQHDPGKKIIYFLF